jgi:23S rRNA (guanosine2251-2'-O)-methyltransferase
MATYITGFHAIEECLKSRGSPGGARIEALLVAGHPGPRVKQLQEFARGAGIRIVQTDNAELKRLSGSDDHRGLLLAVQESPERQGRGLDAHLEGLKQRIEALGALPAAGAGKAWPCILALDSITDPHNLGAILRSADKFGVDLVMVPQRRSAHETETVRKSSAGASAWVDMVVVGNLGRAIEQCREAGFWVCGADMAGEEIHRFDGGRPLVIVMGSEGKGLGRLLGSLCDQIVSIPCTGHVDSLNVSVATAVILYEIRRQQGFAWK